MLPARVFDAIRRLLGRPPSDWMGPDEAPAAIAAAGPIAADDRHEIVALWPSPQDAGVLHQLAAAGHRVFAVSARASSGERPYEIAESAPHFFEVALPTGGRGQPAGLDALRLERGLGATVCLAADAAARALAERLRAEQNWPTATSPSADLTSAFPVLSVVIVTYGNRDLNRLCLESLAARNEWPNREVIVVDNGSTDGTRELLTEIAARRPEVRPILLDSNRGYPAAVNAGLERATGRFLVLLNNDTVLVRGTLTALLRHLARDSRLGLVGPVTNAIANEARIDVGYRGLETLSGWAADWMRRHDGETRDIPSLAFFCVAMTRETLERVGPLDERFGPGMFEDGDYCRRVRGVGLDVRLARDAFVHHWQMASFRRLGRKVYLQVFEENRRKFEEKWGAPAPPAPASQPASALPTSSPLSSTKPS